MSSMVISASLATGPFLSGLEAARYCGYSQSRFLQLASEYQIPRHGPFRTKYSQSQLDAWMISPKCFILDGQTKNRPLIKLEV